MIQKLRLRRGWSQEELAELSGLSVRTIQRIERGSTASTDSLKALGAVFDVDFSTLKEPDMTIASPTTVDAEEALAFARARRIKGFYIHAAQFALAMALFLAVSLLLGQGGRWILYVACGWGTGVAVHGLRAFEMIPLLNADWERRAVEAQLGRRL